MPWDKQWHESKVCVVKKGETNPLHCYEFAPGNEASKAAAEKRADKYLAALYVHEMVESYVFEQADAIEFDLQASDTEGDILVFRNAILARAEVNANHDEITPEGIQELAASIAGKPIDDEHELDKLVGVYTAGRATDGMALEVDGFIWADRWPQQAEQVRLGLKKLSVEASARKATCSVCKGEYTGSHEYCEHIFSKRAKEKYKATRTLYGLKAKGGAITLAPAATDAGFGKEIYMVANHSDSPFSCPYCEENIVMAADSDVCPVCGINVEAEITRRKDVSEAEKKHAEKEYGDVEYADEKNKKYPIDTEAHIRAAWNYIHKGKNAAKYSSDEVAAIKRKIAAAWRKKIDKEGPPSAKEENEEESSVKPTDGTTTAAVTAPAPPEPPAPAQAVPTIDEVNVLKAEIEKLKAALDAALAAKAKAEEEKQALEARYAAKVLSEALEGDELNAALEKAKGMSPDQIDLVASIGKTNRAPKATGVRFVPPAPAEQPRGKLVL